MASMKRERDVVIFCFLVLVLIGVPVWWKTTQIYRAPLPTDSISQWSQNEISKHFKKFELNFVFLTERDDTSLDSEEDLASDVKEVASLFFSQKSLEFHHIGISKESVDFHRLEALTGDEIDNYLQENHKQTEKEGVYSFFILCKEQDETSFVFGKYRHAWVWNKPKRNEVKTILMKAFEAAEQNFFLQEFTQVMVRPSPKYKISFHLLSGDCSGGKLSWDFTGAYAKYLEPFFQEISAIATIEKEAQVLHCANLLQEPKSNVKGDSKTYSLPFNSLGHFLNPVEWRLDVADSKTLPALNFIVFVPEKRYTPLHLQESDGSFSSSNSFVIPQWGGIVIYNRDESKFDKSISLSTKDLENTMQLFVQQLREIFGISSNETKYQHIPSPHTGIAKWERDVLIRRFTLYHLDTVVSQLKSLSKLVDNLNNMAVTDFIGEGCRDALDAVSLANQALKQRDFLKACQKAKEAVQSAERVVFDPSMLSLLYFPDEHKYAIYALPFFPVFFQLLSGIYNHYKNRFRSKK